MAFDSLTEKLQNVFKNLRSKGKLTEDDINLALREVKLALLEADVNFRVVKYFMKEVKEKALGQDVMNGLNPGQMVIKIVHDELIEIMGGEVAELELKPSSEMTVVMAIGLQGSGKTTTLSKLAGIYKKKGRNPLLVACDIYRPAAIEQLKVNGEKVGIPVFEMGTNLKPVDIVKEALNYARENHNNLIFIDTAGRLQIDEDMMIELEEIKANVQIDKTLLVVDAMTGQEAVNVAETFNSRIGIDGAVLTKLDGDSRGGAALSVRHVTQVPILFAGMGEKLSDLEQFYPDRMASRILGMGDVLSLIEKAEAEIDFEEAKKMEAKVKKAKFDFNDYLSSMQQLKKMGGISSILSMLPGVSGKMSQIEDAIDESKLKKIESIIYSMTPYERANPDVLNPSRRNRVAKGAGVNVAEVNRLCKQFKLAGKQMKQMSNMIGGKGMGSLLGKFKMPF